MSKRTWVSGVKNGVPVYLNLHTLEERYTKPENFDEEPQLSHSETRHDCTDTASRNAKIQLEAGIISQEEYVLIMSRIQRGQEVVDIDQFLHNGPDSKNSQNKNTGFSEMANDPELIIKDLNNDQSIHILSAKEELPLQQYDTFDHLYIVDKDTGVKTFLNDVQVEQFDTFQETEKRLGARAGAAKMRRRAKQLRDEAPTQLRVKMFNALQDLNQRLQTPRGQRILVGESAYFGGSLIKTRAAMVMAVQVKLTRLWKEQTNSDANGVNDAISASTQDHMSLTEFVDVLQLMGFNATIENAAKVVARWGQADSDGRIHFREFLQWCDLDSCFVKSNEGPESLEDREAELLQSAMSFMNDPTTSPVSNKSQSPVSEVLREERNLLDAALQASEPINAEENQNNLSKILKEIEDVKKELTIRNDAINAGLLSTKQVLSARDRIKQLEAALVVLEHKRRSYTKLAASMKKTAVRHESEEAMGHSYNEASFQKDVETANSSDDAVDLEQHSTEGNDTLLSESKVEDIKDGFDTLHNEKDDERGQVEDATNEDEIITNKKIALDNEDESDLKADDMTENLSAVEQNDDHPHGTSIVDINSLTSDDASRPGSNKSKIGRTSVRIHQLATLTEEEKDTALQRSQHLQDKEVKRKKKKKKKKKKSRHDDKNNLSTINLKEPVDIVKALHSFEASDDSELTISVGEILEIYRQHTSGWWYAKNESGKEGFIPHNYVESINDDLKSEEQQSVAQVES